MTEYITSLSYAKKGHGNSLKTTVPIEVVRLLEVEAGDKLIWEYTKEKMIVTVGKKVNR